MMKKTRKDLKLLLVNVLIFCNSPKVNGKILLGFWRENQGDATKICNHCTTLLVNDK